MSEKARQLNKRELEILGQTLPPKGVLSKTATVLRWIGYTILAVGTCLGLVAGVWVIIFTFQNTNGNDWSSLFQSVFHSGGQLGFNLFSIVFCAALVVGGVALYFLPTIVANKRGHRNTAAIFVLNLLAGWTFVGWVIAMVWAVVK